MPARKPMLRWPVASTAARAPMIANRAASEKSISVRLSYRSARAPPTSTVERSPTPCSVSTKPSERAEPVSVNVRQPSATTKAASPSSEMAWPVQSKRKSRLRKARSTRARDGAAAVASIDRKLSSARDRPPPRGLRADDERARQGREPRDGRTARGAGRVHRRRPPRAAGEVERERRDKLSNTSIAFGPDGEVLGIYRKIHLFDVEVGGHVYRESEAEEPGAEPVVVQGEGWPVGLTVCYDVRFPELYRILALEGAELVTVPAHFTTPTGKDH